MTKVDFDQTIAPWLALQNCAGIGRLRAKQLLQYFGSPAQIFAQPMATLSEVLGSRRYAQALGQAATAKQQEASHHVFQWLNTASPLGHGVSKAIITQDDPRYPASLKEIDDPPLLLYALGAPAWLAPQAPIWWHNCHGILAMVGSRTPTPQGELNAFQLSAQLQQAGICVVSGLARGIDAAAHSGALHSATGQQPATIAIMGTGIDQVYPREHHELARCIANQGLLLTEQALGAGPLANHFPQRNRIITGLSQATLVVEATEKSGSLISARLAAEQGRDVMAIPGSIHSPQSKGCHWLIKQGAKLVENAADILEDFGPHAYAQPGPSPHARKLGPDLMPHPPSEHQASENMPRSSLFSPTDLPMLNPETTTLPPSPAQRLLQAMGYDPIHLEQLQARTGLATGALQAQLLELELQQQVRRMPGELYQRLSQA